MKPALFCFDVDGTLFRVPEEGSPFKAFWEGLVPKNRPVLVYNSGRFVEDQRRLVRGGVLPEPDFFVGGLGTEFWDNRSGNETRGFSGPLAEAWNRETVEEELSSWPGAVRQPAEYQNAYKSSWYLRDASSDDLEKIRLKLTGRGLRFGLVYSSSRDLDVLAEGAGKGEALKFLCAGLDIGLENVLVAGDSGNDGAMFALSGVRGIVPGAARGELLELVGGLREKDRRLGLGEKDRFFVSEKPAAWGLLEGLSCLGFKPEVDKFMRTAFRD